ncbi:MAG: DEAD/DEAH box helicase [Bifidobacteriaceae bacterium]|jgi:superfamily II DNA/RNA helicase|nr:DEAD/DEAH box helicase [Bifidobacteriaceae bacterium]
MSDTSTKDTPDTAESASSQSATDTTFVELGVPERIASVLSQHGKTTAFPIQKDTLPDTLAGKDVLGRGETGSGKTLAYSIPLVARLGEELLESQENNEPAPRNPVRALILAPTRELVNQIDDVIRPLARTYGMRTTTIFGGVRYSKQISELRAGAQIVLACPGRLEDLLSQKALSLDAVQITVLDEADLMADLGFLPSVNRLLQQIPEGGQHLFFSATLDHGIDTLVKRYLHDAKVHEIDAVNAQVETMTQHVFEIKTNDKAAMIETLASGIGKRILFTRTKHQAEHLAEKLTKSGIPAAQLHGNLSQNQRDRNMSVFKSGAANVLVATDVAARGVDIPAVELVVQVDPPKEAKSFLHRSGRTARAGQSGDVVTLVTPDQRRSTRRMLRQAAIKTAAKEVTSDSPEVLDLVGEKAQYVDPRELARAMEDFTRDLTRRRNESDRAERNRNRRNGRGGSRNGRNHDRYEHDRSGGRGRGGHDRNRSDRRDRDRDDFSRTSRDERGTWHDDNDFRGNHSDHGNRQDRRNRDFGDDRKYRGNRYDHDDFRNDRKDRHNDRSSERRDDRRSGRPEREHSDRYARDDRFEGRKHNDRNRYDRDDNRGRGNDRYSDDRRGNSRYDRDDAPRSFHGHSSAKKAGRNPFSDQAKANSRENSGARRRNGSLRSNNHQNHQGGNHQDRQGSQGGRNQRRGGKRY